MAKVNAPPVPKKPVPPPPTPNKKPATPVEDDDTAAVGLSDVGLSQSRREMLDLVNRLQATGVQVDIDLPQIAVIGSQSAGKSSLIESISGITLPRAAGTCTRCPTECRLSRASQNSPWQCKVTLRFTHDKNGQVLGQAHNKDFGGIIYDKALVEERIRRAQRAILNPSLPSSQFLDGDDADLDSTELTFSSNVVSLAISGPGVADLSFCDLPGLIASVSSKGGSSNDIALVESLVTSYIKKPSCIILLTVACETDFENQGAHRLAKVHDPEGKRTIGVLTKPDRIPMGEERGWIGFIRNEREPLDNNWYCVKQPSSNDLKNNMTWAEARKREEEFFAMTAPWCDLDSIYHKYLRTRNLVERLSGVLSDLISKRLPEIQEELERGVIATRQALDALPTPPSTDPVNDIAHLLHIFTSELRRHTVEGIPSPTGLLQAIRPAQQTFRKAIRGTAPHFLPFESGKGRTSASLSRPRFLDNEEEDGGVVDQTRVRPIYVDEVYKRARVAITRELPGHYPFVVQQEMVKEVVSKWLTPAETYLRTVQAILSNYVKDLVSHHFGSFGQGALEQRIKAILHTHLSECFARAENRIRWFIQVEGLPFTLNQHYLSDYKDKFLSYYKAAREEELRGNVHEQINSFKRSKRVSRRKGTSSSGSLFAVSSDAESTTPPGISKVLLGLSEMGIAGTEPEDIYKILPPDEMTPAINIMADVRAYFQVSYKRFADNIPLAIDYELVQGIERDVLKIIYGRLGINGPDGQRIAEELAQESAQVADKREDLVKKLERLRVASSELLDLGLA
ncbi:P-loop containing nucleoside triphosphate hydrolase protein [Ephemerocybe angulata]|uniref:P-loop containing nucleoside triphosphate hydrolase protein n=1 Tax=Ephemerocybe angulata TaxID=980116 RepID=A0A8H6HGW0_9AGAR|nr:P-loop containing nucleoside triphosphate hydrolase protein [Tulosesus angulatus]